MKNTKRLLSLLLIVFMLLQYLPGSVVVIAAGDLQYNYSSQYNSGKRGEIATTLNGTNADSYYSGSYEYDTLSQKSGQALIDALDRLMTDTHSHISTYQECHDLAHRTDCEQGKGNGSSKSTKYISLFYTGYTASQNDWVVNNVGWNREHVWPQSKGKDSTSGGGADLHHVRPACASVNSSRGNKAYGNVTGGNKTYSSSKFGASLGGYSSSSYFYPKHDGNPNVTGDEIDIRGDVARICLYVYVRWGSDWGATKSDFTSSASGVFQSIDVLLEWCALDPVDTWELGRNEVVEDIQGNRNVFIDYPEYAWLIFGREVPEDMTTPSGNADDSIFDGGNVVESSLNFFQMIARWFENLLRTLFPFFYK